MDLLAHSNIRPVLGSDNGLPLNSTGRLDNGYCCGEADHTITTGGVNVFGSDGISGVCDQICLEHYCHEIGTGPSGE